MKTTIREEEAFKGWLSKESLKDNIEVPRNLRKKILSDTLYEAFLAGIKCERHIWTSD